MTTQLYALCVCADLSGFLCSKIDDLVCVCACVCVCVCIHVYVRPCMFVYIYTHFTMYVMYTVHI